MIIYENKFYFVEYNSTDSRLYFYKIKEGEQVYLGNRHIADIIDIVEQNNEKEGV